MRMNKLYLFLLIFCLAFQSCNLTMSQAKDPAKPNDAADLVSFEGEVVRIRLEGGFWGIVTADGQKYDPIAGFEDKYKIEGLKVKGKIRFKKGMVHFHMWGKLVEIVEIEIITNH